MTSLDVGLRCLCFGSHVRYDKCDLTDMAKPQYDWMEEQIGHIRHVSYCLLNIIHVSWCVSVLVAFNSVFSLTHRPLY